MKLTIGLMFSSLYFTLALIFPVSAQTATPNPDPVVYSTLESGQLTRFEYKASAADIQIANILTAIFVSLWGMFIIFIFVIWRVDKR